MAVVASSSAFAQVIRTEELRTRFTREPDFESESRALVELAQALASNPRQILDRLVQSALDLCRAGSTGISILDSETGGDPDQFRWHALAGAWTDKYLGSLLPRDHSPCGVVLSRNSVQLMTDPAKYYHYVSAMDPPCREVLLVPFSVGGVPIGTLWAVMHDERRFWSAHLPNQRWSRVRPRSSSVSRQPWRGSSTTFWTSRESDSGFSTCIARR
jgi:hypothetical protein